jgi:hypothetical protein
MNCDGKVVVRAAGEIRPGFIRRLPHGLQHATFERWSPIKKENAVMRERKNNHMTHAQRHESSIAQTETQMKRAIAHRARSECMVNL